MKTKVADTPNNWVQVRKTATGFSASVGKETFDVTLNVDISDVGSKVIPRRQA